eukprot:TRINITY_DN24409_c0_g2_i1.p1 TRINITY_DN24409_c0_g2~~TRINITY_DN24409_c0_g2_i1.p1  ORF type:complete len:475 (-),score=41.91 TRINITY_DN24409_c0_g2_i1:246-1670(-)
MSVEPDFSSTGSLTVAWCTEPDDWLLPVAHAMENAAFHCKPPPEKCSDDETIILKVLIQKGTLRDRRASLQAGLSSRVIARSFSSPETAEESLVFVAERSPLVIPPDMVLKSRLGLWLRSRGLIRWCLVFLSLLITGLVSAGIGRETHSVTDPSDESRRADLQIRSLPVTVVEVAVSLVFYFFTLHTMCWGLLREVSSSFDCLLIVSSRTAAKVLEVYEVFTLAHSADMLDLSVIVSELIYTLFISVPVNMLLGCADTIVVPRRAKFTAIVCGTGFYWWLYVRSAYFRNWSSTQVCLGSNCQNIKELYENFTWNCGLFLAKFAFHFIRGREFCVLRSYYEPPEYLKKENMQFSTSQMSKVMSDASFRGSWSFTRRATTSIGSDSSARSIELRACSASPVSRPRSGHRLTWSTSVENRPRTHANPVNAEQCLPAIEPANQSLMPKSAGADARTSEQMSCTDMPSEDIRPGVVTTN